MPLKNNKINAISFALSLILGTTFITPAIAQDTLILADAYIDVAKGKSINDAAIIVSNNQIIKVTTAANINNKADYSLIDLKGKTLVPGVMDMHVHLSFDAEDNFLESMNYSVPRQTVKAVKNAQKTLLAGFTRSSCKSSRCCRRPLGSAH